ncbi:ABC transporter permease [Gemelliphila palaticanis]|uniref:ABC transporter permease n=1 Tax=Gemelliphila palaticanis TaxID=81950 RepID=A0ABX2T2Z6_9BACL|nr:ABC transporter permease [Gemella palaticanis]MBF0715660.1 ABC transporter permease [Gemella palaticanis]NYS47590.1 ABC transporter permease [Gemella palaticanis]
MSNITTIFSDRIIKEKEKRATYNKYIFNSHLVMFLLISFGAILFNYSSWLDIAKNIEMKSVLLVLLIIMAYLLSTMKIKTFIKEADSVFLLPLENRYKEVIKKLYIPTIITRIFFAIFFIFVSYPIIKKLGLLDNNIYVLLSFIVSIVVTIIIYTIQTYKLVIYGTLDNKYIALTFVTYLLSSILFVLELLNISLLVVLLVSYLYKKYISVNVNWYGAAEYDSSRQEKYLKLVNMFVDVPIDVVKVKRRKYLDILLPSLNEKNFNKENSYNYYFLRAFLRQENTIFLVLRLFLVALLFLYNFNNMYVSFIVIVSFNYLSVIQLLPLYKRLTSIIWFYTIPVKNEVKLKSFKKLINIVLAIFTIILVLIYVIITKDIIYSIIPIILSLIINNYFLKKLK